MRYIMRVAPAFVTARPRGPISHAAWNASSAREVTQILSEGRVARTIVQADAQKPSMMTLWREARSRSYLYMYFPINPPRSSVIRTAASLERDPATMSAAMTNLIQRFIPSPLRVCLINPLETGFGWLDPDQPTRKREDIVARLPTYG